MKIGSHISEIETVAKTKEKQLLGNATEGKGLERGGVPVPRLCHNQDKERVIQRAQDKIAFGNLEKV